MAYEIKRSTYAEIYGPTTGDRLRLGDTGLVLEVEHDHAVYGDECKFGGGKVLRDGMGQAAGVSQADALDLLITNALVVDSTGIFVLNTMMAKGALDMDDPHCGYTIGLGGKDVPAVAIEQADLVISLGYDMVEYHPKLWNPCTATSSRRKSTRTTASMSRLLATWLTRCGCSTSGSLATGRTISTSISLTAKSAE